MPLPDLDVPTYPFVPLALGVPPLARAPIDAQAPTLLAQAAVTGVQSPVLVSMLDGAIPSMLNGVTAPIIQLATILSPVAVTGDVAGQLSSAGSAPQWGIFDSGGSPVIVPDSVASVEWAGSYRVLDYTIEEGNFNTYNKVVVPFQPRVVMRKGGSVSDRQDFVNTLMSIRADLNLYTVATPEISWPNQNITDVSFARRAEAGATLIEATITLKQINVAASSSFSNVQNPTSQDTFNGGTVETQAPTSQQSSAAQEGPS